MTSHYTNIQNRVYVGNLEINVQPSQLFEAFSSFGNIKVIHKKYPTYAFVEFDNPNSALIAIKVMNGTEIAGRRISVKTVKISSSQTENDDETHQNLENSEKISSSGEIRR